MLQDIKKFSFKRKLSSYDKVQKFEELLKRKLDSNTKIRECISNCIRSKKLFINRNRINHLEYLNVGCGYSVQPGFVNVDYNWNNVIQICWDISHLPYPFKNNQFKGIFTEHCLEHVSFNVFNKNLAEFYRLLKPGGTIRIVLPDPEIWINWYSKKKQGIDIAIPYGDVMETPIMNINNIFRNGHQYLYDFETAELLLKKAGFKNIVKEQCRKGRDSKLLIDLEWRKNESLYIEAEKPL